MSRTRQRNTVALPSWSLSTVLLLVLTFLSIEPRATTIEVTGTSCVPVELDLSSLNGTNGFAANGEAQGDLSGYSVTNAGDLNHDSIQDIIIGAYHANPNGITEAGTSYVVFGKKTAESSTFPSVLELSSLDGTNGFAVNGEAEYDHSGWSVSYAGDVNGDAIDDIIIGAYRSDPNGMSEAGKSYVVFGKNTAESTSFPVELELSSLDGTNGFAINGEAQYDRSGRSVSYAGDVNGDTIDDIIIGAWNADPNGISKAGTTYVVFGKNTSESTDFPSELELSSLDGTNGFAIHGEAEHDNSGYSVSNAGDVNGDSIDDVIIGARYADPNGKNSAGTSYVVFGKDTAESTSFPSELELSSLDGTNGFAINGEAQDDLSGNSVSYAGDINDDYIADIIIGAIYADPNGITKAGTSYVVFGKSTAESTDFLPELELSSLDGTNGFAINGEAEDDQSGWSVSYAGDVNGDNIGDIIIGAYRSDPNGISDAGKSYVVFGKNTAISTSFPSEFELSSLDGTNGFAINGEASSGDNSGRSVSYAGDMNGDDVDDIIIGAFGADPNGKSNAGTSYVVFGIDCTPDTNSPTVSPTATPTTPTEAPTKAPSNQPTESPTEEPTTSPTKAPSKSPTVSPTKAPTKSPTESPTNAPTISPTNAPSKSPTESPTKGPTTSPTEAPTQSPTPYPLGLVSSRSIEQSIAYPFSVEETVSLINNHHEEDIEVRIVGAETDDENDLQLPAWIEPISEWVLISPDQSEATNMVFALNSGNLVAGAGVIQHFVYFQWRFVNGGEDPPGEIIVDPNPLDVSLQIVTVSINPTALTLGIALAVPSQGEAEASEASTSMLNLAAGTSAIWNATITCVQDFGNTDCSWFELIGDTEGNIDPSDPVPTQLRMKISAGSSIADEDWGVQSSMGLKTHIEDHEPYKVVINVALEINDNEGDDATPGENNSTTTTSTIIDIPVEVRPSAPCSPGTFSSSGDTRSGALCTSCPTDQYQPSYGSTTCFPCPSERSVTKGVGSTSQEKDCVEKPGDYRDASGNVRQCPEGTNCSADQIGLTLTTLPLAKGYWRAGNSSIDIRKCPKPEFCIGGSKSLNSRGDGYCADNHEGVYCLSCAAPYSKRRFDYGCVLCGADQVKRDALGFAISSITMVALAFLIVFIGVISWRNYKNKNDNVANPRAFEQRQSNEQHDLKDHGKPVTEVGSSGKHDPRNMPNDYDHEEGTHPHTGAFEVWNPNTTTTTKPNGAAPGVGFLGETLETSRANAHKTSASSTEIITSQSRLVIGFFQVADSIGRNFPLELPSSWVSAMESIGGVLALDILGFLDIGCANKEIGGSHYMKLIGAIVGPVVAILLAVVASISAELIAEAWKKFKQMRTSEYERNRISLAYQALKQAYQNMNFGEKTKEWFATMHMGVLFLIYPLVSLIILQTFSCETFDNGDSALIADYSIDCNSDTYQKYRNLAIFGVLLYPTGVPVYLASILFWNRHRLSEASKHDPRIRMLAGGYREGQVYFEIVEMLRKLLQTSIVVFILPGGATQIFSQAVITMVFLGVLIRVRPYAHGHDYFLAVFVQFALLMISNIALMNRLDVSQLEEQRTGFNIQALLDWILLLVTVLPLILCIGIVTVSVYGSNLSRFKVNVIASVVGIILLSSLIGYVFAAGVYAECAPGCATCVDAGSSESRCQQQLDTMENCGKCGNNCDTAFPNAEGRCEMVNGTGTFTCPGDSTATESERGPFEFECKMTDCLDGFLDLNDDSSDGCESEV